MDLQQWIYAAGVFGIVLLAGLTLQKALHARVKAWVSGTKITEGQFLTVISRPLTALIAVSAFSIASQFAPSFFRAQPIVRFGMQVSLILIITWLIERIFASVIRSSALSKGLTDSSRTIVLTIARVGIFVIGALIVLDTLGVSITPILASLGVGSVAVALALQDTLSNLFGGLYILADKPIRVGDLVKVDGVEGNVVQIGWRSTRIRTGSNDTVIVPNSKVSSGQLRNYDLPSSASVILIPCSVAYDADLHKVERITLEVADEVAARMPEFDRTFAPLVRFTAFGDSSILFELILRVVNFTSAGLVRHELIKALHARFNSENIEIPFPQRVIHWNPPPGP